MYDLSQQVRIAKNCTEASLGYAEAATQAYSEIVSTSLGALADFARDLNAEAARQERRRRSWFRVPEDIDHERSNSSAGTPRSALRNEHRTAARTALRQAERPVANPFAAGPWGDVNPFKLWLDMMPMSAENAANWPGAYVLIACGLPRSVAWPMARANAAALEAATSTAAAMRQTFPAFHSESGYAAAALWSSNWPHPAKPAAMMAGVPTAADAFSSVFWPWLRAA
ncbi:MAG: hypothetical protein NW216_06395 [Hyphomicrobium sp.]|nr:hypothetical protein [Hyphomicrobium sp.]